MACHAIICGTNASAAQSVKIAPSTSTRITRRPIRRPRGGHQRGDRVARRQQREERVLPADERHEPGDRAEPRPLPRRAAVARRDPGPDEAGDRRHRRSVRHARFLDQVPEDERAQDGESRREPGQARAEEQRRQAEAEPAADQAVEEPRDADGLTVRKRDAVGVDVGVGGRRAGEPPRGRPRRTAPRGSPGQSTRLIGRGRSAWWPEQVRLVAETEQRVVVREIEVAIERQRIAGTRSSRSRRSEAARRAEAGRRARSRRARQTPARCAGAGGVPVQPRGPSPPRPSRSRARAHRACDR